MKRFKRIYVEISNICNLTCPFCPLSHRPQRTMCYEEFCHILNQIQGYSDYLYFHVKGEPLLHPELGRFLDKSYEMGFKVNLTSNGTLIHEKKDILLNKPAIRQISFSLQGLDTVLDQNKKEKKLIEILCFTKEAIKKTNMNIELRLWNLNQETTQDSVNNENSEFLKIIENELEISKPLYAGINKDKGVKISERIYLSQSYIFEWPDITREELDRTGFCYGLKNQLGILADGTVVPCCLDSEGIINLGNIFIDDLANILNTTKVKDITESFSRRQVIEPLCQRCGYRSRFA